MTTHLDHALLPTAEATDAVTDLSGEAKLLTSIGFRQRALVVAQTIADRRGTTMAEELIRLQYLDADDWWQRLARDLGVRYFADLYLETKPRDAFLPDGRLFRQVRQVWHRKSEAAILVIAPLGREIDRLRLDIAYDPSMRRRIAIASPQTIRLAFRRSYEPALTHQAIDRLKGEHPAMSAARGPALTRRIIACFSVALAMGCAFPLTMLGILDLLFLTAGGLRLASAIDRAKPPDIPRLSDADLPTYTVLVPLFREARMIGSLIRALERIDYPRDRVSMCLVIEADDRETMSAALFLTAGSRIRVIAVPPSRPRTKPKALTWALPFAEGELLTVYDAEDRPAPDQLRRAAAAFAIASPDLMCIQAVLDIDHAAASSNWLARQFALEYRVLFRALLPSLARKKPVSAARRNVQSFSPRCPCPDRRLGPVQRDRGCRYLRSYPPHGWADRRAGFRYVRRGACELAGVAFAADALDEGLAADLARSHAAPRAIAEGYRPRQLRDISRHDLRAGSVRARLPVRRCADCA